MKQKTLHPKYQSCFLSYDTHCMDVGDPESSRVPSVKSSETTLGNGKFLYNEANKLRAKIPMESNMPFADSSCMLLVGAYSKAVHVPKSKAEQQQIKIAFLSLSKSPCKSEVNRRPEWPLQPSKTFHRNCSPSSAMQVRPRGRGRTAWWHGIKSAEHM